METEDLLFWDSALGTSCHLIWASLFKAMLPNAQMPHKKHLWQIFHLIAWILKALVYTAYPLQRYLPRQFTPISGAKSLKIVCGLASAPHFWCVVAGILDCHWKSHAVARQLFRISSMWPSNPNSSQRRWSWTPWVLAMSASPWQFVMGNVFLISLWKELPQEPTWGLRKMNGKDHSNNRSDILKTCLFNHFDLKT